MEKPTVKIIGQDGNIFSLIGICSKALKRKGLGKQADEMRQRIMHCESYDTALTIIMEYVEVE